MTAEAVRIPLGSSAADPTRLQQDASHPESSAWVNASAGSGKTTVLTKRVLRLLLAGVPPERILCLTFTRAAAAEMSIRVTRALGDWVTCDDEALDASLDTLQGRAPAKGQRDEARRLFARALECPGGMRIRTIHSFAQEILKRFSVESGLPPHFAVIEPADASAMLEDATMDLLRDSASCGLGDALGLLVCDLGEDRFRDALRAILHQRVAIETALADHGGMKSLNARMRSKLSLNPGDTEDSILEAALASPALPEEALKGAARALLSGTPSFKERGTRMLRWFDLSSAERGAAFDIYCGFFLTRKNEIQKKLASDNLLKANPDLDATLRREAARLLGVLERMEAVRVAEMSEAVVTIGLELALRYRKRKAAQAVLDYDDLIAHANALLNGPNIAPWILYKLDGGIDHILVDEAQDTSRAQWDIVRILADEFFAGRGARDGANRTLFVVGDEKQSIFSFQNADPAAFAEMRGFFRQRIRDADKDFREIPFGVSFRSAPAILRAVDAVFASERTRSGVSIGAVAHESFTAVKCGRVEVWPLIEPPGKEAENMPWTLPESSGNDRDPQVQLAAIIARRIREWLDRKEKIPGEAAPVSPGDIMILLRRRGRFADAMVRALKEADVPVTGVDRMRLVEQLAVMDLLALMRFALLPEDDLTLATVLRGPLLAISEDELMRLAVGRAGSLWQSLAAKRSEQPFAAAYDYLAGRLGQADFLTPFAMLARVLNEPCPASSVSGRRAVWSRLGADALDPIEELLNAAQTFGARHAPSMQHFLHWLTASDSEISREMDQGSGQVRVMTVHASKGLEAPIVILPDTAAVPRPQDVPKLLWNAEGLPFYLSRRPLGGEALDLWCAGRARQMEEYRRLLYVALTRAANRLYVCGWKSKNSPNEDESWHNLVTSALAPLHEPGALAPGAHDALIAFEDYPLSCEEKGPVAGAPIGKPSLPAWAITPAARETVLQPIAPSKTAALPASATPDDAYARGRIIHRLLQSLPDIEDARREDVAARFLGGQRHRLTPTQREDIAAEVLRLLRDPAHAAIFAPGSEAEVPLAGIVAGRKIAGQVDRLCRLGDEIWIVDYKTNRPPPANASGIPAAYREQMESYRAVLQAIYPDKRVRCFLLWTYGPRMMEVPRN